jgi:ElaB/YqjD/DUF883 family membrane-anchored ribosome-binding protein
MMDQQTMKDTTGKIAAMSNDASERAQEAAEQGKAVWQDAKATVSDTVGRAVAMARDATAVGTQAATQAGEAIQGVARQVGDQASRAVSTLYDQGTNAGGYVSRYTAEQPWTALLLAAAIGYGLAYLIHRP